MEYSQQDLIKQHVRLWYLPTIHDAALNNYTSHVVFPGRSLVDTILSQLLERAVQMRALTQTQRFRWELPATVFLRGAVGWGRISIISLQYWAHFHAKSEISILAITPLAADTG